MGGAVTRTGDVRTGQERYPPRRRMSDALSTEEARLARDVWRLRDEVAGLEAELATSPGTKKAAWGLVIGLPLAAALAFVAVLVTFVAYVGWQLLTADSIKGVR